jgi:hypothetical protein
LLVAVIETLVTLPTAGAVKPPLVLMDPADAARQRHARALLHDVRGLVRRDLGVAESTPRDPL